MARFRAPSFRGAFDSISGARYPPQVIRLLPVVFAALAVLRVVAEEPPQPQPGATPQEQSQNAPPAPGAGQAQVNPPQVVPPAPVARATGRSLVAVARDSQAMNGYEENPAVTRRMVDALVRTVTGRNDTREAWRDIVRPDDRVGIKVTAAGGPLFSTRRGVVAAIVSGVREAGVREVFVWDRSSAALRQAGFTPQRLGCEVRAIDPPRGWDRQATIQAPTLGKLIWGDLLFSEKSRSGSDALLSSKSHLATILSKDVTCFINVPALSDEPGCGVAGALHSAVVGNVDNWRRFTVFGESGASAIADSYMDPRIGGKCVLNILDALAVTYGGGPSPNPHHSAVHNTLYASMDPVALDGIGLRLLEKWRAGARLGPVGTKAAWLSGTNVGNADENMIILQPAR